MRLFPSHLLRHLRPMVRAADVLSGLRRLPVAEPGELIGHRPVLVLAPHPMTKAWDAEG